jgi:dipeptidyl aminopeptidase/acylaminoacyl peptidase
MTDATPYGEWPSPLSSERVTGGGVGLAGVHAGERAWWLERRADDGGRGVLVREGPDGPVDVTPPGYDVRTRVHEYGGGDFLVHEGTVWFANDDDQRLYRQRPGGEPEPVTPDPAVERGDRYADLDRAPDGTLYGVRERHGGADGPTNGLVALPEEGDGEPRVVAEGHDFYSSPRVSPGGDRLAWLAWDHPAMPWDATTLYVADRDGIGLADERAIAGGPASVERRTGSGDAADARGESLFGPSWGPDGDLHVVSDRTGWWNLYRLDGDDLAACYPDEREWGVPSWRLGAATYAVLDDGRVVAAVGGESEYRLGLLEDGTFEDLGLPFADVEPTLHTDGESVLFVAAGPTRPPSVVRWAPGEGSETVFESVDRPLDAPYVSEPEHVAFPTGEGGEETAHALYYPPRNPEATAPGGERPPLVVRVHGGPTGESRTGLSVRSGSGLPPIQYLTTRGIAVADVNYRGSAGYGRAYRDRLKGEWGFADVADCVNCATHLADAGRVDGDRLAVDGGSAGGFAALCALCFHETFDAGISFFGVADLAALAEETHEFESRYLDGLVGPYPDAAATYRDRSPVNHADGISVPVLLLQGEEDRVVPPEQSRSMLGALPGDVPRAYVEFEGEGHGFREGPSIRRAVEAELAFLGRVFGFDPDDDLPPLELSTGE